MMPIMNVFNKWHAANTSKKIRAVWKAKAKEGVFHGKKASYGYIKGTDEKRTFIIDEETAPIVRRIFEMYASGISPRRISEILNEENVPCPGQYAFEKLGHKGKPGDRRLWGQITIASMLKNISSRKSFGIESANVKSLSRKAEKLLRAIRILCRDFFIAPTAVVK